MNYLKIKEMTLKHQNDLGIIRNELEKIGSDVEKLKKIPLKYNKGPWKAKNYRKKKTMTFKSWDVSLKNNKWTWKS